MFTIFALHLSTLKPDYDYEILRRAIIMASRARQAQNESYSQIVKDFKTSRLPICLIKSLLRRRETFRKKYGAVFEKSPKTWFF